MTTTRYQDPHDIRPPRVYIATTVACSDRHNEVRDALRQLGIGLTFDWTTIAHNRDSRGWRAVPLENRAQYASSVAQDEVKGVRDADLLIVLLPGWRGTHTELGVALGTGVPVLLIPESSRDTELAEKIVPFYRHPGVTIFHADDAELIAEQAQRMILADRRKLREDARTARPASYDAIDDLAAEAHEITKAHGFWEPGAGSATIVERLALVITEVAEAIEEVREDRPTTEIRLDENGKPLGLPTELADTVIRIFDIAAGYGVRLGDAIAQKMAYNRGRPYKHGKVL